MKEKTTVWYLPESDIIGIKLPTSYWVCILDNYIYGREFLVPHSDVLAGWIYIGKY